MARQSDNQDLKARLFEAGKTLQSSTLMNASHAIDADVVLLQEKVAALEEENANLWDAAIHIADMHGGHRCSIDHNGFCQEHGTDGDPCIYAKYRKIVEERKAEPKWM